MCWMGGQLFQGLKSLATNVRPPGAGIGDHPICPGTEVPDYHGAPPGRVHRAFRANAASYTVKAGLWGQRTV